MKYRALFLLVLLAALCGCGSSTENQEPSEAKPVTGAAAEEIRLTPEQIEANGLRVSEVVEDDVAPVITALARVRARAGAEAEVFSPFPGKLVSDSALPRIGDVVSKGQRIADVEQQFVASEKLQFAAIAVQLEAEIQQAQQEVSLKQTELNRARQLYDGGAIPLKQAQTAEFELKQAETKLQGARRAKEQYDAAQSARDAGPRREAIVSPLSGIVIAADATLGQQVDPSTSLWTIADLSTVWVEAAVHERDLPQIHNVRSVEIAIPGSSGPPLTGSLVTSGSVVDAQNRTVPLIFSVVNRGGQLKLQMFVEARIPTGPPARALLIPASAVLSEQGGSVVYVESQPGVYRSKSVELGQRRGEMVVVTKALQSGEKVVVVGAQTLRSESRKGEIPTEKEEKDKKDDR